MQERFALLDQRQGEAQHLGVVEVQAQQVLVQILVGGGQCEVDGQCRLHVKACCHAQQSAHIDTGKIRHAHLLGAPTCISTMLHVHVSDQQGHGI